MFIEPAKLQLA